MTTGTETAGRGERGEKAKGLNRRRNDGIGKESGFCLAVSTVNRRSYCDGVFGGFEVARTRERRRTKVREREKTIARRTTTGGGDEEKERQRRRSSPLSLLPLSSSPPPLAFELEIAHGKEWETETRAPSGVQSPWSIKHPPTTHTDER